MSGQCVSVGFKLKLKCANLLVNNKEEARNNDSLDVWIRALAEFI